MTIKIICPSEKTTQQVKRCTIVSLGMWSEQNNQEETESPYQAKQGEQPMIIDMSMYQTNIAMKYRKSDIWSPKSRWSIISMSQHNIQAYIKNSQCAIKRQVLADRLIKCHVCFILSSSLTLYRSPVESPFCGPRISTQCVSHSNGELDFYLEKWIFIDYLEMTWSSHLFLFYF